MKRFEYNDGGRSRYFMGKVGDCVVRAGAIASGMDYKEVYNLAYHIIWCPKYRKKVLVGEVETRLKELLLQKAEENGWEIENMKVMPDHVHIFVKTTPSDSPALVAAQLKGFTSHQLREEFPHLRSRLPTLWTRSYYTESVGHISEETIKKYIDEQKLK